MGASQKRRINVKETDSSVLVDDLERLAKKLGIDLSLADDMATERILNQLPISLSDETVHTREKNSV